MPAHLMYSPLSLLAAGSGSRAPLFSTPKSRLLGRRRSAERGHTAASWRCPRSTTVLRASEGVPEDQVLMRALRDFNVPKIVSVDEVVFHGLLGGLLTLLRTGNIHTAPLDLGLQRTLVLRGLLSSSELLLEL